MGRGPEWMRSGAGAPVELHTDRPHAARVYDFLLGGKTNYAADREAAQRTLLALPNSALIARQNRAFMHRAAHYLAEEAGVRQFLDIGTGIPTSPNLHEVVQAVDPRSRIVYADNDPIVLTHSRALHTSHPDGRTAYLHGDLCRPEDILAHPELSRTLDLGRPVALTLVAVLHWLPKECDPYRIVARLLDALPSGSFLALTHVTDDFERRALEEIAEDFQRTGSTVSARSKAEVAEFFAGLELVEPGVEVVQRWRPDDGDIEAGSLSPTDIPLYGGVARKL
ncbi:SAM-dependent methyltransferase [Streptomyces silvisoli]|uniref:SAM-dependent methyltransferase n=1 Tax=Streptomyces silvisoli TaxID=3034235 RepID=A0ABT5ZLM2_9ACTN|nr:SAM-dependent methyltransferase [Streptomyces silvisoli]MDF3290485.1 SAM-dependent methyltransferase [Streptomyces silvisoli]